MPIINYLHSLRAFLIILCLGVFLSPCQSWGDELYGEDSQSLFSAFETTPVTTSHIPRPTSKIAENVTVITSSDIERLNAHTLADVLQTVPGIQFDYLRTPTNWSFFSLQGALNTTVLVLVDGIRQNDYDQGVAAPALIPVQQIERIEIIKGAASASWGSALGGVINIVTKSPDPERTAGGMVTGSIGSRLTADSRAELSGTVERFGYYLTAGNIRSDGLVPGTATKLNNFYGKVNYALPGSGTATAGVWHLNAQPGLDEGDLAKYQGRFGDSQDIRRTNGFLKLTQPLGNNLHLEVDGYVTNRDDRSQSWYAFDNSVYNLIVKDATRGANTRLIWGDSQRNLVVGAEYGHVDARSEWLGSYENLNYDTSWDQWALFTNAAYSIGDLTLLPGIRFDRTGRVGDNTSYTMGATYQLQQETTLRVYAADGFSLPMVFTDNKKPQKIKTLQAGFETATVPYLWLKGTGFYNVLRSSESAGTAPSITDQIRKGFEVELRTTPLQSFSLASGYTYLYAKDKDTGKRLESDSSQSVPPHIVKLKLNYDNSSLGLRGTLTGNYVWWNSAASSPMADQGMIWDLHLNWKLKPKSDLSPELFFSGHNLFNGTQTTSTEIYNNAGRWFDGGIRVKF
jgi:vitamin B12 transporter